MSYHRVEAILAEDGIITLQDLPFKKGDSVEVIITEQSQPKTASNPYPLRGTVYRYDNPFEPAVNEEDWEALQ